MLGIGLLPFVVLPWVLIGPIVWGFYASAAWHKQRRFACLATAIASASLLIPALAGLLYTGMDAAAAAMVMATLSLLIFLAKLGLNLLMRGWRHFKAQQR